jgi:hypothetical protein
VATRNPLITRSRSQKFDDFRWPLPCADRGGRGARPPIEARRPSESAHAGYACQIKTARSGQAHFTRRRRLIAHLGPTLGRLSAFIEQDAVTEWCPPSTAWTFGWLRLLIVQGPSESCDVLTAFDSVVRLFLSRRATCICKSRSGRNRRSERKRPHRAATLLCDGIVDNGFELKPYRTKSLAGSCADARLTAPTS